MSGREFLILARKFPLVDSLWGKQVPHYKHKRRSNTYLSPAGDSREEPREIGPEGQHTGKLSGKCFCCFLPRRQRFAVQMQRSLRSW